MLLDLKFDIKVEGHNTTGQTELKKQVMACEITKGINFFLPTSTNVSCMALKGT